jgi:nicotinate phosphoribosyltransferase
MNRRRLITLKDVASLQVDSTTRLFSAESAEIETGLTSDIYFIRTRDLLGEMGLGDTEVTAEIFSSRSGIIAGSMNLCTCYVTKPLRFGPCRKAKLWEPKK